MPEIQQWTEQPGSCPKWAYNLAVGIFIVWKKKLKVKKITPSLFTLEYFIFAIWLTSWRGKAAL